MSRYNDFKREVATALVTGLFGRRKRPALRADMKFAVDALMRQLDKTFVEYGVDWKLNEDD